MPAEALALAAGLPAEALAKAGPDTYYSIPRAGNGRVLGREWGYKRPWRGQKRGFADAEGPFGKMGKAFLCGFVEFCSKTGAELTLFCRNVRVPGECNLLSVN